MRVKVGNTWFEATPDQPIMVELTDTDRSHIERMSPNATQYACFHEDDLRLAGERRGWMAAGAAFRKPFERLMQRPRFSRN